MRAGWLPADLWGALDQEHGVEHTHHLSRAQAALGDARMTVSGRPLRTWTFPTVLALAASALAPGRVGDAGLVASALGLAGVLAGFRQPARPLMRTTADRVALPGTRRRTA